MLIDEDFDTLAALLGNRPYFFGSLPSVTDACVFGFLECQLYGGNDASYLNLSLRKHPNLVHFIDRIRERFFADKIAKSGMDQGKAQ